MTTKCRSPRTFKHLKAGSYVLRVRAVGTGGGDKTPATYTLQDQIASRGRRA